MNKLIRALRESDRASYWNRRARSERWRTRLARASSGAQELRDERQRDAKVLLGFTRSAIVAVALALLVAGVVELAAVVLSTHLHVGLLFTSIDEASYDGLVVSVVGAEAVFLALYFTTVGVVAATSYAHVPVGIRELFVRERRGGIYVRVVLLTLIVGLAIVVGPLVTGRHVHGLSIVFFSALGVMSAVILVRLGFRLFYFFDPSALSEPLPRLLLQSMKAASTSKSDPGSAGQDFARQNAVRVVSLYQELCILVEGRELKDARAPWQLAQQLLGCWGVYSFIKPTIPTKSRWFQDTPQYPNWLTLDHNQLSTALETRTSVQPTLAPDPLWIERRLADMVADLVLELGRTQDPEAAVALADKCFELMQELALHQQVDEARLLRQAVDRSLAEIAASAVGAGGQPVVRYALAQRRIMGFITFWLGLARAYESFDAEKFSRRVDRAVANVENMYRARASRNLLAFLEEVREGESFERDVEGRIVTPAWWVHHLAARHLARDLVAEVDGFVKEIER